MLTSTADAGRGADVRQFRFLARVLVSYAGLAALLIVFALATLATAMFLARPINYGMAQGLSALYSLMMPVFLLLLLVIAFVRMAVVERPGEPIRHFASTIRNFIVDPERVAGMAIMSVLVMFFMANFSIMKDTIPLLHPFSWDQTFQHWDRFLFGGLDAWELTFATFGTPAATTAINAAYNCWLFVIYMFLLGAVCGLLAKRLQLVFLYAFIFTWVVGGVVLAIVFSSAGPVYFARLGLGDDFEPQMQLLRQFNEVSPVWSLTVQELLWTAYSTDKGFISGISAMPSMHVASTVVVTMLAYRINRVFGHAMLAFSAVIFIGSVHLGWHYAVDGLLGAAIAVACWYAAERVAGLDLAFQRRVLGRLRAE
jgi:hypothetical protein